MREPESTTRRGWVVVSMLAVFFGSFAGSALFVWTMHGFISSTAEDPNPTIIYALLLLLVSLALVFHVAVTNWVTDLAGWVLAIGITAAALSVLATFLMLGLPFLLGAYSGWDVGLFFLTMFVGIGPAMGVCAAAGYWHRSLSDSNRTRTRVTIAIVTVTAIMQLVALHFTRSGFHSCPGCGFQ